MKSIWKNKKFIIPLVVIILLIIVIAVICFMKKTEDKNKELLNNSIENNYSNSIQTEETHTMYVSINPLVKLVFKEKYSVCKNDSGKESICGDISSEIIEYELVNDDAKDIYKNLNFNGNRVEEVLLTLCDIARNNNITFEKLEITTDSNYVDREVLLNYLKENSTYDFEYVINVNFEEKIDEEKFAELNEEGKTDNQENNTNLENKPNDNESNKNQNTNNSEENNVEVSNITSTINKINLNDNILVTEWTTAGMLCGYLSFINGNVTDVIPNYNEYDYIEDEEFNLIGSTIGFNQDKENNAVAILQKIKTEKLPIGVSNFNYTFNNHKFTYNWSSINLYGDYDNFSKEWENQRLNWESKLENAFIGSTSFNTGCGDYQDPMLLNEQLCNKYNLNCDRW